MAVPHVAQGAVGSFDVLKWQHLMSNPWLKLLNFYRPMHFLAIYLC